MYYTSYLLLKVINHFKTQWLNRCFLWLRCKDQQWGLGSPDSSPGLLLAMRLQFSGDWTRPGQSVTDSLRCLPMDAGCHMCRLSPAGQPQPIDTMPAFKENKSWSFKASWGLDSEELTQRFCHISVKESYMAQPRFKDWGNRLYLLQGGMSKNLWPVLIYHIHILLFPIRNYLVKEICI